MMSPVYKIRNYRPADFTAYFSLVLQAEKLPKPGCISSPQLVRKKLNLPGYSPEADLFLAESNGKVIGYLNVLPEVRIGRIILECFIHPDHRRRGLARILLDYALRRGRELGVQVTHVNIPEENEVAGIALSRLGFRFMRRFFEMSLHISDGFLPDTDGDSAEFRHFRQGEEDKLVRVQNRSFAGSWGFQPNTVEEIIYRVNLGDYSPDDIILSCDRDRITGYCWTRITQASPNGKKGQIFMLGVDPGYRGMGIGRGILRAGLSHLKKKSLQVVVLTADSENTAACRLYRSLGFRIESSSLWYEKLID
ncbi:MAG: GNAT family N-acetyltransferase [Chloroflexota bacterium]